MDINATDITWLKSSHSSSNGGNCIEVGVWRKSSHSGASGGDCVEVTILEQPVGGSPDAGTPEDGTLTAPAHKAEYERLYVVRDSKNPDGPKLYFTPAEWEAFRLGVLDGEFDDLAE